MFGLLSPKSQTQDYRHAYAQVCREHHLLHGKLALPFHSYESVLFYLLADDLGYFPHASGPPELCCRLRSASEPPNERALEVSRFAAHFSLLLAWVKLSDDVMDDRSYLARVHLRLLESRIRQMFLYFRGVDPKFRETLNRELSCHAELECGGGLSLDTFAVPTGNSFAYLFELYATVLSIREHTDWLRELGRLLGSAIICFDVAADYHSDRRKSRFNPLSSDTAIPEAINHSKELLARAAALCQSKFPNGRTHGVLRSIEASITVTSNGRASKIREWVAEANPLEGYRRGYLYVDPSCGYTFCVCFCGMAILKGCAQSYGDGDCSGNKYTVRRGCGGDYIVEKKGCC